MMSQSLALAGLCLSIARETSATTLQVEPSSPNEELFPASLLISRLINPGSSVVFSDATISAHHCKSVFSNGGSIFDDYDEYQFFETGVILGSGFPENAIGPNDASGETHAFGQPGDSDLDALLDNNFATFDACVLKFDIDCPHEFCTLNFNYIFGSEEYLEFVGSVFNDVFGLFVDGENIAVVPGTTTPVSINNVNDEFNSEYFVANVQTSYYNYDDYYGYYEDFPYGYYPDGPSPSLTVEVDLQGDGFTTALGATKVVGAGLHTVKFAVADAGDGILDSWIFLEAGTLQIASVDAMEPVSFDDTTTDNFSILEPEIFQNVPQGAQKVLALDETGGSPATVIPGSSFTTLSFYYSANVGKTLEVYDEANNVIAQRFLPPTTSPSCLDGSVVTLCEWVLFEVTLPGIGVRFEVVDLSAGNARRALQSSSPSPNFALTLVFITPVQVQTGVGGGDPHFLPWGQSKRYSFHGECDLVYLHVEDFHDLGLDIHMRTTLVQELYSFVEAVAVRIGDTVVEFLKEKILLGSDEFPYEMLPLAFTLGNHEYKIEPANTGKGRVTNIILNNESQISVKSTKQFMTVSVSGTSSDFGSSQGLLGEYHTGKLLGRQGQVISDTIEFGLEWQVRPEEALFSDLRQPQLPYERCRMPSQSASKASRRRLKAMTHTDIFAQASKACNGAVDFDLCMHDVLATGELDLADEFF